MSTPEPQPELVPFEIVREETRQQQQRTIIFKPSRWQIALVMLAGALLVVGTIAAGMIVAFIGLLIAVPLMIVRFISSALAGSARR